MTNILLGIIALELLLFFQTLTLPSLRQSPTIILTARL